MPLHFARSVFAEIDYWSYSLQKHPIEVFQKQVDVIELFPLDKGG